MLDIVIVAHHKNYTRLAHRGLKIDGDKTRAVITGTLPSAVDAVGTPGKVVMSLEGGERQDFEAVESYLASQNLGWQVLHSSEVTSYREAVIRGIEKCESAYVAVIPGWLEVMDPQWVYRMMWPMGQDGSALLCATWAEQGAAKDLAPTVIMPRKWPEGGKFFIARRQQVYENLLLCTADQFEVELGQAASANGWRIWAHPGVRFQVHEHEEHARKTPGESTREQVASSNS